MQQIAGAPSAGDQAEFTKDPKGFCAERARKYGPTFATGAFDGAVFVGDADALSNTVGPCAGALDSREANPLAPPFEQFQSADTDPFETYYEDFNSVAYQTIFEWIPKVKEAGFSTFRFGDFIDGRIRKLRPSIRTLLFRATAPAVFGVKLEALPALLGLSGASEKESLANLDKAYGAYALGLIGGRGFLGTVTGAVGGALSGGLFGDILTVLGGDQAYGSGTSISGAAGDAEALEKGVEAWAARTGADRSRALWELASSIEQATALLCNLLVASAAHPQAAKAVASEQASVLKGTAPDGPITPTLLRQMPALDAFARETMRLYPPCRPLRFKLASPVQWEEQSGNGAARTVELAAGVIVAPEPFAAHFTADFTAAERFDPSRYDEGPGPALMPFATAGAKVGADGDERAPGERLALSMAKAAYVQIQRMFDVVLDQEKPPTPSGYPLYTIGEGAEVLMRPKMYYELQRGVKKLNF